VRRPGSPLTERAVNFIVKEAAERAGINPAASIHWLRHAYASHASITARRSRSSR
jgi:integrase/recombinase XerD